MAIPTYVPLIISLIALVVPVLNLLRILLESAEGYRKCSEAVIGPWSRLRWRRWSWSEFRFEVHFVTPKLELQDISETRLEEVSYQERFLTLRDRVPGKQERETDDAKPKPGAHKKPQSWYWRIPTSRWKSANSAKRTDVPLLPMRQEGDVTVGDQQPQSWYRRSATRPWKFSNSEKRANALLQSGYVLDNSLTHDFDNHVVNMECHPTLLVMRDDEEQVNAPPVKYRFVSDQRVSWLSFLRHLHRVQNRTASASNLQPPSGLGPGLAAASASSLRPSSELGPDPWAALLEKPHCANLDLLKCRHPTGVSVSFVEWTWDSLPAKATRPMATTTLGTLVIMATRLGMQWRIDLEKDSYQAAGNGYSLSCTHVPEMDLVATFTAEERNHRRSPHALAFNTPTDKFMCGIIPGVALLVDEDFHCTDDSGKTDVLNVVLNAIDRSGWLRQRLNLQSEGGSDKDHTRWTDMMSNEMTALLCEFLPHEGANDHIFWGWKEGIDGRAMCPLNSPQFLHVFLAYLDPRFQSRNLPGCLEHDVWDQLSQLAKLLREEDDEQLTQYAQRIFERTTLYFVSSGFDQERHRQKLYLHMAAAHCNLSSAAWDATLIYLRDSTSKRGRRIVHPWKVDERYRMTNKAEEGKSETQTQNFCIEIRTGHEHEKSYRWTGQTAPFEVEVEVFARKYLEEAEKISGYGLPHALMEYFEGVNCCLEEGTCRDAWLVMMLRGIAWFLSQKNKKGQSTPVRNGGAIPSSLWDNQRPVWII